MCSRKFSDQSNLAKHRKNRHGQTSAHKSQKRKANAVERSPSPISDHEYDSRSSSGSSSETGRSEPGNCGNESPSSGSSSSDSGANDSGVNELCFQDQTLGRSKFDDSVPPVGADIFFATTGQPDGLFPFEQPPPDFGCNNVLSQYPINPIKEEFGEFSIKNALVDAQANGTFPDLIKIQTFSLETPMDVISADQIAVISADQIASSFLRDSIGEAPMDDVVLEPGSTEPYCSPFAADIDFLSDQWNLPDITKPEPFPELVCVCSCYQVG